MNKSPTDSIRRGFICLQEIVIAYFFAFKKPKIYNV